jgi:UDP-N-acetylmuramate dehydrogenase
VIENNVSLKSMNTLAIDVSARYLSRITSKADLIEALEFAKDRDLGVCVLGKGSNIVLTADIEALVLVMAESSMFLLEEDENHVVLQVSAGYEWDDFVAECLHKGWYGLENLSLIPGTVGAAPVQNIGAYGVEVAEHIVAVHCVHIDSGESERIPREACHFAYRDSVFKQAEGQGLIITSVEFSLDKVFTPKLSYAPLAHAFAGQQASAEAAFSGPAFSGQPVSAEELRQRVIAIRQSKLPDPANLANAGSFFKNPIVDASQCESLTLRYPNMPLYALKGGLSKLAAGWLIEQAGWKGKALGPVGMHKDQALVLVNYGGATAKDVECLKQSVVNDVFTRFSVVLEQEPVSFPSAR